MIPYVDPKSFGGGYSLNKKSDIYSIGVLFWEISGGRPPFSAKKNDIGLALEISQGLREEPILNTPEDYIKLYTGMQYLIIKKIQ